MLRVLSILMCAHLALTFTTNRECWDGFAGSFMPEFTEIKTKNYFCQCINGEKQARGCFAPNGDKLFINDGYIENEYELTCLADADMSCSSLHFKMTACIGNDGRRYVQDAEWADDWTGKFWHVCRKINDQQLRKENGGCISESYEFVRGAPSGVSYYRRGKRCTCRQYPDGTVEISGCY